MRVILVAEITPMAQKKKDEKEETDLDFYKYKAQEPHPSLPITANV